MYRKDKKSKRIILCVVIVLCLMVSSVFINRNFDLPDFFIRDGILFVDRFLTRPFESFSDKEYDKLRLENEELKRELDRIKYYESENSELVSEINKLKDLVKINKLLSDKEYINASVISRGLDYWNDSLMIDKGTHDGVGNNMAVVSGGSLIGITDNVSIYNSNVLLLSNSKFPINISVKIKLDDMEVYGILNNFSDGVFEVMGIVENVEIPEGAAVVTTGLGNIFPSGLLVGHVSSVTRDNFDLSKIVNVKSDIDFDDINYAIIVKRDQK